MSIDVSKIATAMLKCESLNEDVPTTKASTNFVMGCIFEKINKDYVKAVESYRLAAEAGFPQAQNNLGWMYANGRAVERDFLRAYMWFHLAGTQRVYEGKINCNSMKKFMKREQIDEAKCMAKKCRKQNYKGC